MVFLIGTVLQKKSHGSKSSKVPAWSLPISRIWRWMFFFAYNNPTLVFKIIFAVLVVVDTLGFVMRFNSLEQTCGYCVFWQPFGNGPHFNVGIDTNWNCRGTRDTQYSNDSSELYGTILNCAINYCAILACHCYCAATPPKLITVWRNECRIQAG